MSGSCGATQDRLQSRRDRQGCSLLHVAPVTPRAYSRRMAAAGAAPAYGAIAPGTDLSQHARQLVRIHDAVLAGVAAAASARAGVVARSWSRVVGMGLDPDTANERVHLPWHEVEARRTASPLALVIDDLRATLTRVADASLFLMVVCDADGVVLWREGAARVRMTADRLGFAEGARWTERRRRHQRDRHRAGRGRSGRAVLGRALRAGPAPLVLHRDAHPRPAHRRAARRGRRQRPGAHPAPRDRRAGRERGPARRGRPLAAPRGSARAAAAQRRAGARRRQRAAAASSTTTAGSPTTPASPPATGSRPRGSDHALAVPGLGLCLPERLGDGWLVRPRGGSGSVTACLDRTGEPVLDVASDGRVVAHHADPEARRAAGAAGPRRPRRADGASS